jgi:hypothetical protein
MNKKPKVAHENHERAEAQSNQNKTGTKKIDKFLRWFSLENNIVIAILVIIGSIIWFSFFKNLIQYLEPWLYLVVLFVATYVISTFFSKAVKDGEGKKRKLVKWLPILLVFIFHFLPVLDRANFNSEGEILNWINIENGTIYHRSSNEIHEDINGDYFFDPVTGDTCRRATNHWRMVYKKKNYTPKSVYITKYDTLFNEIYSSQNADREGVLYTDVYGYDLNKLENPEVIIINLRTGNENSVVIGHVNTCVKIYASCRNPVARYRYKDKVTKNLELSIPLTFKGAATKAQVLVLEKKGVRQVLAQK